MSGFELGNIRGYVKLREDQWITVYQKIEG
jgi:hypothetical protein